MAGCDLAAVVGGSLVVVLDLEGVSAGLVEVDRVGEVTRGRVAEPGDSVVVLALVDVRPRRLDLGMVGDTEAVVVRVGLRGGVGPALVNDEKPFGVGVLHDGNSVASRHDFGGQQAFEDRQGLVQRTAFVVPAYEPFRLDQRHAACSFVRFVRIQCIWPKG